MQISGCTAKLHIYLFIQIRSAQVHENLCEFMRFSKSSESLPNAFPNQEEWYNYSRVQNSTENFVS